jgi:CBS domain-containing protein
MRRDVMTVAPAATSTELETLLVEGSQGRLPVVDSAGQLLGLITRTDLLRQQNLYPAMHRRVA